MNRDWQDGYEKGKERAEIRGKKTFDSDAIGPSTDQVGGKKV